MVSIRVCRPFGGAVCVQSYARPLNSATKHLRGTLRSTPRRRVDALTRSARMHGPLLLRV
jgi:hypothetical protein